MRSLLSKTETVLVLACVGLLALTLFGPPVAQPGHYHGFADQRTLFGLPFFMDVMSNMAFAVLAVLGAWSLYRLPRRALSNVQRAMAALFFGGLLLTAAASSWYHWAPDDTGLAIDRGGMALAFAGVLGLAAAGRVSERAGAALGLALLLLAPLSIHVWSTTGNVLPWAALQFGGVALLLWLALLRPRYLALDIRWGWVIFAYPVAKLLEMNDHDVYHFTGEWVSGHTLKHVVAALAAVPVVAAIGAMGESRQNAFAITKGVSARRASNA